MCKVVTTPMLNIMREWCASSKDLYAKGCKGGDYYDKSKKNLITRK